MLAPGQRIAAVIMRALPVHFPIPIVVGLQLGGEAKEKIRTHVAMIIAVNLPGGIVV
jgi:hypothetical protein